MKIYDSFLFFNELDLLEIRLNLLNDYVDYFVISESNITFSGNSKPLYYEENKDRFRKFESKIIHQVITDTPTDFVSLNKIKNPVSKDEHCLNTIFSYIDEATNFPKNVPHWGRDFYQRECLHRALVDCNDDDVIIFSDLDEIPNPNVLNDLFSSFPSDKIYTLRQKEFSYYLNMFKEDNWMGSRVGMYSIIKNISLNKIRAVSGGETAKSRFDSVDIQDGGWHFTNQGGVESILLKIESWGHQEFNTKKIKSKVRKRVESGKDIFNRRNVKKLIRVDINENIFPKWLVENQDKYKHLISESDSENKQSIFRKIYSKIIKF